jgi:hypothetical protein
MLSAATAILARPVNLCGLRFDIFVILVITVGVFLWFKLISQLLI